MVSREQWRLRGAVQGGGPSGLARMQSNQAQDLAGMAPEPIKMASESHLYMLLNGTSEGGRRQPSFSPLEVRETEGPGRG